jgi:TP901 family phage tail tape measure protein
VASISEILLVFRGESGPALAAIEKIRLGLGSLNESAAATHSKLGQIGAMAAVAIGTGVVAAMGESIKKATEFQKELTMIHTQAGQAGMDLNQIGNDLLKMAPEVGVSATDLATQFYHFASANIQLHGSLTQTQVDLDATRAAAQLAKMGNASYEDSAQAIVGVLSAMPEYAGRASEAAAGLNAIVGTGDMRMQQLTAAMATGLLPAAHTAKLGLVDVGAALATLTDNVTPADEAATRLRMTIALLQHQSGPATDALATIGITAGQLGEDMVKPDGLLVAVGDLREHLAKTFGPQAIGETNDYLKVLREKGPEAADAYAKSVHGAAEVISVAFGGGRTSAAIQTLLGEFDKFSSKYPDQKKLAKDFSKNWEETKTTFSFQMDSMRAGLDSVAIKVGQVLLPAAGEFLGWLKGNLLPQLDKFADWFKKDGIRDLRAFGDFLNVTVVPAIKAIGHAVMFVVDHWDVFKWVLLGIIGPLLAAKTAMAIGGVAKGIVKDIGLIVDAYAGIGRAAIDAGKKIADMAETGALKFMYLKDSAAKAWVGVSNAVSSGMEAAANGIAKVGRGIGTAVEMASRWTAAAVETAAEWGKAAATTVANFVKMAASATLNAAKVAASWVAEKVTFLAGQAVKLASWLVTNAIMLATAIATGVGAAIAFLLPLAPFILIGAAVIALVALIVLNFGRIRDFLGRVWDGIKGDAAAVWTFIWEGIIKPVVNFIVGAINSLLDGVNAFLGLGESVLSNIPGLGGLKGKIIPHVPTLHAGGTVPGAWGQEVLIKALAGERVLSLGETAGGGGGGVGTVNVYHPTANVDVVSAIDRELWLRRMRQRGVGVPAGWPTTMAAG